MQKRLNLGVILSPVFYVYTFSGTDSCVPACHIVVHLIVHLDLI